MSSQNSVARSINGQTRATRRALLGAMLLSISSVGCNTINGQASNSEGVRLYQQGAYEQAASKFQEAIANDPNSADGYYNLAASLHKTGALYNRPADVQQAELLYNQCLERDPNHVDCYRGLAVLLSETKRPDAAFRLLNNWNAASPNNPSPKIELARLLEETGQPEQAKTQLVNALVADPSNSRAFTALGRLRDQTGDHQQALANYQRSLEIDRFQPQVAARVASLQAALGGGPAQVVGAPANEIRSADQWRSSVRY